MGLFSRNKPEPQPKDDYAEVSPVQQSLDRMNELETEVYRRIRHGARKADPSRMMLEWEVSKEQRKLLHEYGVTPVVDEKTGKWKLFGW